MTEEKLSSDIVRKISELQPEKRGQLLHIPNERNNQSQVWKAKSIGIVSGVADFLFFDFGMPLKAMEIKVPGSRHEVDHIKRQLEWGKKLEANGGIWRMILDVNGAVNYIHHNINSGLTIIDVESMLEGVKTKTIKIDFPF